MFLILNPQNPYKNLIDHIIVQSIYRHDALIVLTNEG